MLLTLLLRSSYPYQQNNNMLYLCGLDEPDSALLIYHDKSGKVTSTLFVQENDAKNALWSGPRCGVHRALTHFGVEDVCHDNVVPRLTLICRL